VTFLGNPAITVDDIYGFEFTVMYNAVYNTSGDSKFGGNFLDSQPIRRTRAACSFEHIKEPAEIDEEITADRAAFAARAVLVIPVV
jgi:hypothetical protein